MDLTSEDLNVEHLLGICISIDANSNDVWDTCINLMRRLFWHKRGLIQYFDERSNFLTASNLSAHMNFPGYFIQSVIT